MKSLITGTLCGLAIFVVGFSQTAVGQVSIGGGGEVGITPVERNTFRECKDVFCIKNDETEVVRQRCGPSEVELTCSNTLGDDCAWTCSDW